MCPVRAIRTQQRKEGHATTHTLPRAQAGAGVRVRDTAERREVVMRRILLIGVLMVAILGLTATGASAKSGTPVSLTTALAFGDSSTCNHTPNSPCPASGTFTAEDSATAALI